MHHVTDQNRKYFSKRVSEREKRKLRARVTSDRSIWFGLGTFGVVGWSVVIPTVIGAAIGIWIDAHDGGRISWTLMLIVIGLVIGCLNAWFWVERGRREIDRDRNRGNAANRRG